MNTGGGNILFCMKKIIIPFLFALSVLCHAKSGQETPEWVLNYESVYPASKYIAQKGTGKKADEAKLNAIANISFYFNTNVNAKREVNFKSYETSDGKKTKVQTVQDVERKTYVDTDTSLKAMEFTEPWKNKKDKTWHCVAYIKRETLWNEYEPVLRVAKDNFAGFYDEAQKSSEPLEKIRLLAMAKEQGYDFLDKISYAQFLSESLTNANYSEDIALLSSLNSLIQKVKNQTQLFITVNNDSGNMIYSTVTQILTDNGFVVTKDRSNIAYKVDVRANLENFTDDDLIVFSPSVNIEFIGKNGAAWSYSKDCGKVKVYTKNAGVKKSIQSIKTELDSSFNEEFNSAVNGINKK